MPCIRALALLVWLKSVSLLPHSDLQAALSLLTCSLFAGVAFPLPPPGWTLSQASLSSRSPPTHAAAQRAPLITYGVPVCQSWWPGYGSSVCPTMPCVALSIYKFCECQPRKCLQHQGLLSRSPFGLSLQWAHGQSVQGL